MKLYTEEQLFNTVNAVRYYDETYDEKIAQDKIEKHLKALEPIQLPTEEEIEHEAEHHSTFAPSFKYGVKFVFDKILNQQHD